MIVFAFGLMTLAFAIFYIVARTDWLVLLAKWLFLFAFMITCFEIWVAYTDITTESVFVVSVIIVTFLYAIDMIMLIPMAVKILYKKVKG